MTATKTAKRAPATAKRRQRDPHARWILVAGVVIAGFVVFLPTKQLVSQHMRIGRLEDRSAALQAENDRLEREVEQLEDPNQLELEARERLGLVRPGERMWVLVPPPPPSVQPDAEAADEPGRPWWSRWWDSLVGLVRGD